MNSAYAQPFLLDGLPMNQMPAFAAVTQFVPLESGADAASLRSQVLNRQQTFKLPQQQSFVTVSNSGGRKTEFELDRVGLADMATLRLTGQITITPDTNTVGGAAVRTVFAYGAADSIDRAVLSVSGQTIFEDIVNYGMARVIFLLYNSTINWVQTNGKINELFNLANSFQVGDILYFTHYFILGICDTGVCYPLWATGPLRLEIYWTESSRCLVSTVQGSTNPTTVVANSASYTVNDMKLWVDRVSPSEMQNGAIEAALASENGWKLHYQSLQTYQLQTQNTTRMVLAAAIRAGSIKSIWCHMVPSNFNTTLGDYLRPCLSAPYFGQGGSSPTTLPPDEVSQWQFRINNYNFPENPVTNNVDTWVYLSTSMGLANTYARGGIISQGFGSANIFDAWAPIGVSSQVVTGGGNQLDGCVDTGGGVRVPQPDTLAAAWPQNWSWVNSNAWTTINATTYEGNNFLIGYNFTADGDNRMVSGISTAATAADVQLTVIRKYPYPVDCRFFALCDYVLTLSGAGGSAAANVAS